MNRRAMTLIEVLAATVLLALLVGTCVPFLHQAMRSLRFDDAAVDVQRLAALADAVVTKPEEFGVDDIMVLDETTIDWPETHDDDDTQPPGPVTVRRIEAPDPSLDTDRKRRSHAWLLFTCEATSVYRWLALDEPTEDAGGIDEDEPGRMKREEPDS